MTYRLAELEEKWPAIPWAEPVKIQTPKSSGLGCRICIANDGVKSKDVESLPQTREEWDAHFRTHLDA